MNAPGSAADDAIPARVGDVIAEKYKLERIVGAGGVGVVFAAEHLALRERVAIKLLQRSAKSQENLARFDREARALARVKSEHVARIMDVGALPTGEPFMVIELLDGQDFAAVIRDRGKLPISEAVDYVVQACEAVALSHGVGIVHRDLKPANLFLTQSNDKSPIVKVLDFGISKLRGLDATDQAVTQTLSVIGSPLYMSPEQMERPRDADERADVWSLGVILYELITGKPPFEAATMPLLCVRICTAEPTPFAARDVAVPQGLERTILRCLAKNPDERYATVAELAIELAPFGENATVGRASRIVRAAMVSNPAIQALAESKLETADDTNQLSPDSSGVRRLAWDSSPPPAPEKKKRSSRAPWLAAAAVTLVAATGAIALRGAVAPPPVEAATWVDTFVLEVRLEREVALRNELELRESAREVLPVVAPPVPPSVEPTAAPASSAMPASTTKAKVARPQSRVPRDSKPDDVLSER